MQDVVDNLTKQTETLNNQVRYLTKKLGIQATLLSNVLNENVESGIQVEFLKEENNALRTQITEMNNPGAAQTDNGQKKTENSEDVKNDNQEVSENLSTEKSENLPQNSQTNVEA